MCYLMIHSNYLRLVKSLYSAKLSRLSCTPDGLWLFIFIVPMTSPLPQGVALMNERSSVMSRSLYLRP